MTEAKETAVSDLEKTTDEKDEQAPMNGEATRELVKKAVPESTGEEEEEKVPVEEADMRETTKAYVDEKVEEPELDEANAAVKPDTQEEVKTTIGGKLADAL